jgi:hypothetical protein
VALATGFGVLFAGAAALAFGTLIVLVAVHNTSPFLGSYSSKAEEGQHALRVIKFQRVRWAKK